MNILLKVCPVGKKVTTETAPVRTFPLPFGIPIIILQYMLAATTERKKVTVFYSLHALLFRFTVSCLPENKNALRNIIACAQTQEENFEETHNDITLVEMFFGV